MTEAIYLEVSEKTEAAKKAGRRVSVSGMLKFLGVSRSGYLAWLHHVPSDTEKRRKAVKAKIQDIYDDSKDNWANLSTYFKYPEAVRRLIYTTNTIEGFNRQLRKVTKSKTVFPSDDSLLKMLYLAMIDITKKWTGHRQDWGQIHSQLEIFFEERLERL